MAIRLTLNKTEKPLVLREQMVGRPGHVTGYGIPDDEGVRTF